MNLIQTVNSMLEALSQRDLDTLTSFFAEDFIFELVPERTTIVGKAQWYTAATEFIYLG